VAQMLKVGPGGLYNHSGGNLQANQAANCLQQFWLDTISPLVYMLEKTEELTLPPEAIGAIQTSLQLMGNANQQNSTACRNALLLS